MKDSSLEITIPASLLDDLTTLADGYTMRGGWFVSRSAISVARDILWQAGYAYTDDEPLPESRDWTVR